ncbi:MAG: repeat-containing protein [Sphingomonas bacterium]|nr:tetratricopeptide repeat protein [Sphingomonas bacterium]MDB5688980.1 repeat-containing protein [Sphingomonas bacterium]
MVDGDGGKTSARAGAPGFGRIALIAGGIVATGAIALSVWRAQPEAAPAPPPAPPTAAAAAESLDNAVAKLEARMKANPGDAKGWRMLGWAYYQMQRYTDAVTAYRRATAAAPGDAEGWSALGEAIALAGKGDIPAEAAAAFRKAVAIDPADARARYFLAVEKDLAGDHQGAIDGWIALLKETPAGAPWEENVRQTIAQAAQKYRIDVTGRVPAPAPAGTRAGPTGDQIAAATALPPGQQAAMISGMVEALATRLKANPKDGDGWIRLMRARLVLGDKAAATQAYRDATAAFAGDAPAQHRIAEAARALGVPGV